MSVTWEMADAAVTWLLWPLAIWIVVSGIDDLLVDATGFFVSLRGNIRRTRPARRDLLAETQRPIAILVPLWKESGVIARMVQQNTASILYRNYHFFIGAYPNDEPTLERVRILEKRYANVHLTICPHPGPTSKADCLNWVFQNIIAFEREHETRFEILVTHDAEDVIHSDALHWINHYSDEYDMVQVPVLPLRTSWKEWTHGVYIDDFTEYATRDMPVRQAMGAFVPSNGVGTGFRRQALEDLAERSNNCVFEPVCLTEDYENGLRLRLNGSKQIFVPLHVEGMATREYFPHTVHTAIRQRTRWITGIALQTWDRHGWPGGIAQKYWLWRDRKGLIGNPASLLANAVFVYGLLRWFWGVSLTTVPVLEALTLISLYRLVYKMVCVARVYGVALSLAIPLRSVLANFINSAATVSAVHRFFHGKWKGLPLVWVKTEHAYPCQSALSAPPMLLGELLLANGYITSAELDSALRTKPAGLRLGEHLVKCGVLSEHCLYEALSLQRSIPQCRVEPEEVSRSVARALPADLLERHQIVPFRIDVGHLWVAGPEIPTLDVREDIGRFTSLHVEYHLVTPSNYEELSNALLPV
jgi:adsorption protein B